MTRYASDAFVVIKASVSSELPGPESRVALIDPSNAI